MNKNLNSLEIYLLRSLPSLLLQLICMISLENNLSSLFYTSDVLKVTWQVGDDIGHILWGSF